MNLKLLANQVFLRAECERSNERCVNADEKERSFPKVRMNAEMNAKRPDPEPVPFHADGRELDPAGDGDAWLCPHCGQPATIDDVFPSPDGERTLTMWSCEPCQVMAVTPDAIKEPPTGWVPKTRQ